MKGLWRPWCWLAGHRPVRRITDAVMRSPGQYVIRESHIDCRRCGSPYPYDNRTLLRKRMRW